MENEKKPRPSKRLSKSQRRRRRKIRRNIWRVTLSVLTVVILVLVGALCAGYAAFRGPSQTIGDLLTVSMQETSALKFVPHIYYSNEEVDAILERNSVSAGDSETDTSLIVIEKPTPTPSPEELAAAQAAREAAEAEPTPSPRPSRRTCCPPRTASRYTASWAAPTRAI
jgi:hypothetical protein